MAARIKRPGDVLAMVADLRTFAPRGALDGQGAKCQEKKVIMISSQLDVFGRFWKTFLTLML